MMISFFLNFSLILILLTRLAWASSIDGWWAIEHHEWASAGPGSESGVSVAGAGCCRGVVVTARCRVTSGESSGGHQHQLPPPAEPSSAVRSPVETLSHGHQSIARLQQPCSDQPRHQDSPLSSCHPPWSRETRCHTVCLHTLWVSSAAEEGRWSPWKHVTVVQVLYPVSLVEFIGLSSNFIRWWYDVSTYS